MSFLELYLLCAVVSSGLQWEMFTIVSNTTTWVKAHPVARAIAATIVFLSWPYTASVYVKALLTVLFSKIRFWSRQTLLN
jgi:hypothetical protein